jgi:hypothetical protein
MAFSACSVPGPDSLADSSIEDPPPGGGGISELILPPESVGREPNREDRPRC